MWVAVGSDNLSMRSWTYDSELSCAVVDEEGGFARDLRRALATEHLDGEHPVQGDYEQGGHEQDDMFDAFAETARKLDDWHTAGRRGPRPPGRLRPYRPPRLSRFTRAWASDLYRAVYDPDGRPPALRRKGEF